jgi:hypothetical protein
MPLDEDLLRQARQAAARMSEAQERAETAKADYHQIVRRLHLAGASLREIADALDISHQRVHQIIEAAGGTGGWRRRRTAPDQSCGFCGRQKTEVARLIAGPGVFICDICVHDPGHLDHVPADSALTCTFCGKPGSEVSTLLAGPGIRICDQCRQLCTEILAAHG